MDGKQVTVVELERANLFVLDSYDPKNSVGGIFGESQLKWLAKALDDRKTKPAVVIAHHPLQFDAFKGKSSGVADTAEFWPLVKERAQVKAFVFGHTHTWKLAERDGIHLINLPAVGYPFAKAEVSGWVDAALTEKGVKLEVRALDPKHAKHGDGPNWCGARVDRLAVSGVMFGRRTTRLRFGGAIRENSPERTWQGLPPRL